MADLFASLTGKLTQALDYAEEQPIREEIFSVDRLEQFARSLATEHKTTRKKGRPLLLPRLEDNGRKLISAYRVLVEAIRKGRAISPGAEWLVDNFHIDLYAYVQAADRGLATRAFRSTPGEARSLETPVYCHPLLLGVRQSVWSQQGCEVLQRSG